MAKLRHYINSLQSSLARGLCVGGAIVALLPPLAFAQPGRPIAQTQSKQEQSNLPSAKQLAAGKASNHPGSPFADVGPQSPKTAFVVVSKAEVYSGPATATYPTSRLRRGEALEVFHRSSTGWLGIRPPAGSFSWVMASDAYLLPGGRVIEITAENAVSWIGSQLGSAKKYRWQVKLQRGEQLAVLGESESEDGQGKRVLWYKIAPPSGEFRWIEENAVALEPPTEPGIARVKQSRSGDVRAASARGGQGERVRSAGYNQQLEVFGESILEGPMHEQGSYVGIPVDNGHMLDDGSMVDGEYIVDDGYGHDGYVHDGYVDDGYYVSDGYAHDGDVIYLDDAYGAPAVDGLHPVSRGMWDGWHAIDLTDDGFRIPFLERRFRRAHARHDPLQHDPFSLAMVRDDPVEPPSIREQVRQDVGISPEHRYTPWRDPRELRQRWRRDRALGGRLEANSAESLAANDLNSRSDTRDAVPGMDELDKRPTTSELLARLASALSPAGTLNELQTADGVDAEHARSRSAASQFADAQPGSNVALASSIATQPRAAWHGLASGPSLSPIPVTAAVSPIGLELGQLQASLSEMVARPMETWNFTPIVADVQRLIESAPTPIERGQARLMLERLEEFEQLARKAGWYPADRVIAASGEKSGGVSTAGYNALLSGNASNDSPSYDASLYDATGWLVPVHASTKGQPTHALTNASGHIVAYVSALPGMNLELYVNQSVGIQGLRGYLPQLKANHIQAQRVVRIQK